MKVGHSIKKSIDEMISGDVDAAMLHACNAVDGTAGKIFKNLGNQARFTRFLRENYHILGPMGAPGLPLLEQRFPVKVRKATTPDGKPDMADLIYSVHRCTHGHGDELPDGFELRRDTLGPNRITTLHFERGKVQLSDRMVYGLIAVAVLAPVNRDQDIPDGYYLTFGNSEELYIHDWWGRAVDFPAILARDPIHQVKLDLTALEP